MVLRNHYGKRRDAGKVPRGPAAGDRPDRIEPPSRAEPRRRRLRDVVIGTAVFGVLVAPPVVARTGDLLREGERNGTTTKETEIVGNFDATGGAKGSYVTRQSNTRTGTRAGGAAIYGCRGAKGGTGGGSAPCLRASNLADGFAFEFAADGPVGQFSVGTPSQPNTAAPFETNATGVVKNLNADKVDGLDAAQIIAAASAGPTGPAGPAGSPGAAGPPGAAGATGAPGSALAWAHVTSDGTADRTEGIDPSKIRKSSTGVYCFDLTGISPVPRVAVAAPLDYGGLADANAKTIGAYISTTGTVSGCSGAERGVVVVRNAATQAETDWTFDVIFEG